MKKMMYWTIVETKLNMYMKIHLSMLYDSLVDSFVAKLQVLEPENRNVTQSHDVNQGFTKIMTTVTINVHQSAFLYKLREMAQK